MNDMRQKLLLLGATRGLGKELIGGLSKDFEVRAVGSQDVDIADEQSVTAFFSNYMPNILIFLAVYNHDGLLHKLDLAEAVKQVDVNSLGFLRVVRQVLPSMREKNFGRIIFISSILARNPIKGTGIYSACKAFGENIIRIIALENAGCGVTANTLRLGYFCAGLIDAVPANIRDGIIASIPLKRLGEVEELEKGIRFILGNTYLTGSTITLAGGLEAK